MSTESLAKASSSELQQGTVLWAIGGCVVTTLAVWTIVEDATLSAAFVSRPVWSACVRFFGGSPPTVDQPEYASVSLLVVVLFVASLLATMAGKLRLRNMAWDVAFTRVGRIAVVPGVWLVAFYTCLLSGWSSGLAVVVGSVDLMLAICVAVWLAYVLAPRAKILSPDGPFDHNEKGYTKTDVSRRTASVVLALLVAAYVIPFVAMNWGQYWNLRTPHGDTAMYEEHLWNVLHGKGFRSYLDQGLFLGEHIQIVHLLLIPIYVLFPSHLTMEFCESLALGSAAIPAYFIATRHAESRRIGLWIAAAVLLYAPLHYLDIEIDRKSFRPICFGVPAMLWAFEFLERRCWKRFVGVALLAVASKEDYTLILGPLGLWLALTERKTLKLRAVGIGIVILSAAYLLLAVKFVIPWFRGGETVHYARYFSQFGETPLGILWGMLTKPGVLVASLVTAKTVLYVLRLLSPLAMTPLLSPTRLLVGAPVLGLLLLNQLSLDPPSPVHHFHAPLVPVIVWAMAAGIGQFVRSERSSAVLNTLRGIIVPLPAAAALCTGLTLSFAPLSLGFYDPYRGTYWATAYVPNERVEQFEKVLAVIPEDARIASTDYVHPRFTHYDRSYDYSGYVRKVAGYENRVPEDTDYIVLDVRGPYSEISGPKDVRELQAEPIQWDVLPIDTNGYFIVLKRRNSE